MTAEVALSVREQILALWPDHTGPEIEAMLAKELGSAKPRYIFGVVRRARRRGDARAIEKPKGKMSEWTKESKDRLRELAAPGHDTLSDYDIANILNKEFGTSFSRNAIIGMRGRMLLFKARKERKHHARGEYRPRAILQPKDKPGQNLNFHSWRSPKPSKPPVLVEPKEAQQGFPYRASLLELNNSTCRWPVWPHFVDPPDREYFFCGEPSADLGASKPYCPYHTSQSRG